MVLKENIPSTCINVEYGTQNRELETWTWKMEYGTHSIL
jgi:hypothetical protein